MVLYWKIKSYYLKQIRGADSVTVAWSYQFYTLVSKYFLVIDLSLIITPREETGIYYNLHFVEEKLRCGEPKRLI